MPFALLTLRAVPFIVACCISVVVAQKPEGFDRASAQRDTLALLEAAHLARYAESAGQRDARRAAPRRRPSRTCRASRHACSIPATAAPISSRASRRQADQAPGARHGPHGRRRRRRGEVDLAAVPADGARRLPVRPRHDRRQGHAGRDRGRDAAARGRARPLDRDIILLGTAAEEGGGEQGIERDPHRALRSDQGRRVRAQRGRPRPHRERRVYSINVQTTEKLSYDVIATARGPVGSRLGAAARQRAGRARPRAGARARRAAPRASTT